MNHRDDIFGADDEPQHYYEDDPPSAEIMRDFLMEQAQQKAAEQRQRQAAELRAVTARAAVVGQSQPQMQIPPWMMLPPSPPQNTGVLVAFAAMLGALLGLAIASLVRK
jgi:hypothetical protein